MKKTLKLIANLVGVAGLSASVSLPALAQSSPSPNSPSPSPGSGVIDQPMNDSAPGSTMTDEPSNYQTSPDSMSAPERSQTPEMTMPSLMTQPSAAEPMMTETMTIGAIVDESPSFELLNSLVRVAAIEEPGLLAKLQDGDYTVFAPTDEAFAALPEGAVRALVQPENRDLLVQLLSYHIIPGNVAPSEVSFGEDRANIATGLTPPSGSLTPNENVGAVDRSQVIDPQEQAMTEEGTDMSSPGGSPTAAGDDSLLPPSGNLTPNENVGAVDRSQVIDPQGDSAGNMSSPMIRADGTRIQVSGAQTAGNSVAASNGVIYPINQVIIPAELQSEIQSALQADTEVQ